MTHELPVAGDEAATLLGSLDRQRTIFAWKTGGLDGAGLAAKVGASAMTLGGLVKHVAAVEDDHFVRLLRNERAGEPWSGAPWEDDPDWEWHSAANDSPNDLYALWRAAVGRADAVIAEALADGGLDHLGAFTSRDGSHPNLRRVLMDMIEEYARHNGHADVLREAVDGVVGEDPPDGFDPGF